MPDTEHAPTMPTPDRDTLAPLGPGEPRRLPVGSLVTGDQVWSAGQVATVGDVRRRDGAVIVDLWHPGATAPEVMHASPGHTVAVHTVLPIDAP